jgi:hypothetical protein
MEELFDMSILHIPTENDLFMTGLQFVEDEVFFQQRLNEAQQPSLTVERVPATLSNSTDSCEDNE